ARTLVAAGPGTEVRGPFHFRSAAFWARRFAHETLLHRADAALAAGTPFVVDPEVALDALDEWMELDVLPQHFDLRPEKRELLAPGRTLALEATDADTAWFVDLSGPVITWRRGTGEAAVTVRAPLTELLLLVYQRRDGTGPAVSGDSALLALWLHHVAFG
ncbi:SCP2 sterol-binding domain-containing protein, partial [Pseudonocardia sp. RS11V-5]|nr:SCP2 sterol-binding domain-containing protein [Pseudonocardia terrae]